MAVVKSSYEPRVDLPRRHPILLRRLANELVLEGRFQQAAELYREALALAPKDGLVAVKLAEALRRAGNLEDAIAAYGQAATLFEADHHQGKALAARQTVHDLRRESRRLARQANPNWWDRITYWWRS